MRSFFSRLAHVTVFDIFHVILLIVALIPALILKLYLKVQKSEIWLICEDKEEARDNGYAFFKYIRETHPGKNAYYAIDKKSCDYQKVKQYGNVIQYGSLVHWIFYLAASKNISSQKGGKPNAAVCYILEIYGILKNIRIFLQHGVTLNDGKWLYYQYTKIRLFICGAYPEFIYVKNQFGYPAENVKYLGFCRFDSLHDIKINSKQILFMPSWRNWIAQETYQSSQYDDMSAFEHTDYFKNIQNLLSDEGLHSFLEENDYTFCFYPHRNMQKFIQHFKVDSNRIHLLTAQNAEISQLLKESAIMITDYSSVSVDFAYMKKPVVYYQFDAEKFRAGQYAEGYFNYARDGFGPLCTDVSQVLNALKEYSKTNFAMDQSNLKKSETFFVLHDRKNCERTYEAIEAIKK